MNMLKQFKAFGGSRIDTARIYAGGSTEPIVGAACEPYLPSLAIGSKAHPSQPGGLSAAGLRGQLSASLEALGCHTLDVCRCDSSRFPARGLKRPRLAAPLASRSFICTNPTPNIR